MKVGLFFGGPSGEAVPSINGARVFYLTMGKVLKIELYFVSRNLEIFRINYKDLFLNTIAEIEWNAKENVEFDAISIDYAVSTIMGICGEDGQLQRVFEDYGIPYLGSPSQACEAMYNKKKFIEILKPYNYVNYQSYVYDKNKEFLRTFVESNRKVVLKPACGGSSLGIKISTNFDEIYEFLEKKREVYLVQEYITGKEFTIGVTNGIPQNIVFINVNCNEMSTFYDKYIPSANKTSMYIEDSDEGVYGDIRRKASHIYKIFGARDLFRIDGFIKENGEVVFSDINVMPGIGPNGFIFMSSKKSNWEFFTDILNNSFKKYGLKLLRKPKRTDKKTPLILNNSSQIPHLLGSMILLKESALPLINDQQLDYYHLYYRTIEDIVNDLAHHGKNISILDTGNESCFVSETKILEKIIVEDNGIFAEKGWFRILCTYWTKNEELIIADPLIRVETFNIITKDERILWNPVVYFKPTFFSEEQINLVIEQVKTICHKECGVIEAYFNNESNEFLLVQSTPINLSISSPCYYQFFSKSLKPNELKSLIFEA